MTLRYPALLAIKERPKSQLGIWWQGRAGEREAKENLVHWCLRISPRSTLREPFIRQLHRAVEESPSGGWGEVGTGRRGAVELAANPSIIPIQVGD